MRVALVCPSSWGVPGGVQAHVERGHELVHEPMLPALCLTTLMTPYDWSRVAPRILALDEHAMA